MPIQYLPLREWHFAYATNHLATIVSKNKSPVSLSYILR
jgi:hypothetical protein